MGKVHNCMVSSTKQSLCTCYLITSANDFTLLGGVLSPWKGSLRLSGYSLGSSDLRSEPGLSLTRPSSVEKHIGLECWEGNMILWSPTTKEHARLRCRLQWQEGDWCPHCPSHAPRPPLAWRSGWSRCTIPLKMPQLDKLTTQNTMKATLKAILIILITKLNTYF